MNTGINSYHFSSMIYYVHVIEFTTNDYPFLFKPIWIVIVKLKMGSYIYL